MIIALLVSTLLSALNLVVSIIPIRTIDFLRES